MTRSNICRMLIEKPLVERRKPTFGFLLDTGKADNASSRLDPFQQLLAFDPRLNHLKSGPHLMRCVAQDLLTSGQDIDGNPLVDDTATDADLFLCSKKGFLKCLVRGDEPTDADSRHAKGL
ncbi:hypothetical protein FOXG_21856 [Fusarium oxysporum f. sp. lycopersici 4287]|uniref:Uncharacterized protein n=1 Tax=Fusarium oxysporum f. sp. lycopersici (strain 4287 / CBS 123668 / FGSC 9935 / NRRL 34936) TaxID=426428 RepID=A0A0J9WU22_FUSO4|nr:hypothetical protein FOXG_21856 [Fusarium oxysporum f. sp. lycopersici 4287]KNB17027.1 hypothetical protein FOXG_21856 [Fusarium oxysporum f. sp. lycopersici 4287]